MSAGKTGFRKDIEGLRAIAVLLVIAYHARVLACEGGYIGVDVFFVLSGYLITGLLVKEVSRNGKIALLQFYARRIRRLLPASIVVLFGVALVAYVALPPVEQSLVSITVRATFAYLSNVYFALSSGDYFASDLAENPLLHTWSLAVEEQFYFVWPLLILLVFKLRPSRKILSVVMAAIGVVSFVASVWLTHRNQPWAFFLMPPRAWEFAVGGLASQIPIDRLRTHPLWLQISGWAGLATIVASGFWMSPIGFPGSKVILPVLGTAAVLIAGMKDHAAQVSNVLSTPLLQYIGQRSYALYLWHWPLLVFGAALVQPFSLPVRLGCALASFVLAEITYRTVENPVRFHPYLKDHAKACVAASLLIMLLGIGGASAWKRWVARTQDYATFSKVMLDLPEDSSMGCEIGFGESIPRECDFGSKTPSKTIVLFGDSHIEQWLPAFHQVADQKNWKIALFVKSACPALAISVFASQASGEDHWCNTWRDLAIQRIRKLNPDAVILSSATGYLDVAHPQVYQTPAAWQAGAHKTSAAFQGSNLPLVFLRDTPWARYNVTECLARAAWNQLHSCPALSRAEALNEDIYRAQVNGLKEVSPAVSIDLSDRICGPSRCDLTQGDIIIYRDSGHLTATFLRSLSTGLYNELVRVVPALAS